MARRVRACTSKSTPARGLRKGYRNILPFSVQDEIPVGGLIRFIYLKPH